MSLIDDALEANKRYAREYDRTLVTSPHPKLAVLTCMDPRLSRLEPILGLESGDLQVIRNGGPALTEDALRSLIVSTRVIGTKEILILGHTRCGFHNLREDELIARLKEETAKADALPNGFYSFTDVEQNIQNQVHTVRSHPWIPKGVPVRGAVYDMETGELREVRASGG